MEKLTRREFLTRSAVAAASMWPLPQLSLEKAVDYNLAARKEQVKFFTEKREGLFRQALLIAGGHNEGKNSPAFLLDLFLQYHVFNKILGIPAENICVLYYQGETPTIDALKEAYYNDPYELPDEKRREEFEALMAIIEKETPQFKVNGDTRKETILNNLWGLARKTGRFSQPVESQLIIFRTGHGDLDRWEKTEEIRSTMKLLEGKLLFDYELAEVLSGNRYDVVISFLNQCHATNFLTVPEIVPNLAMYTANGAWKMDWKHNKKARAEEGARDKIRSTEWSYTQAHRRALNSLESDANIDGKISLRELHKQTVLYDYMAQVGIFRFPAEVWQKTHPGFTCGYRVNPDRTFILQYAKPSDPIMRLRRMLGYTPFQGLNLYETGLPVDNIEQTPV